MKDRIIQLIRNYVINKSPKAQELIQEYFDLTGTIDAWELLPHLPEDTRHSRLKFDQNRLMYKAVDIAKKEYERRTAAKPGSVRIVNNTQSMTPQKGNIEIEPSDLPRAVMTANYSGGALQGSYMGSKYKHKYRKQERVSWSK